MNKSIFILDTPECCNRCPVGRIFGMAGQVECMGGKNIRVSQNGSTIPNWCPLRDFPKRKMLLGIDGASTEMEIRERCRQEGFNACIDEILKGDL